MPKRPLIALDARLYRGTSTGDSSYWTGLIDTFAAMDADIDWAFVSDAPCPHGAPSAVAQRWVELAARSSRVWSLLTFPSWANVAKPDVVHTQYSVSPLHRRPVVTTIHDISFQLHPEWFPPKHRFLLRSAMPGTIRRARQIITVSKTSAEEIEAHYPGARGKVTPIWNGPNPLVPYRSEADRAQARSRVAERWGWDAPFLLSVSTLWPRKNMQLAIDAVSMLPSDLPHLLVLTGKAGWGELRPSARVKTTGYVTEEELADLYAVAEMTLCPSWHEGFGMPLVEAFASGCPVTCSSGGALPEVAGDAAWVMPTFSPQDWASHLQAVLSDSGKLEERRTRGRARAKEFSWERSAAEHLALYRTFFS